MGRLQFNLARLTLELDRMTLRDALAVAVAAPSVAASLLGIDYTQRRVIPLMPSAAQRAKRSVG